MWLPMVTEAAVNSNVLSTYFENIALAMDNWHMALNGINQNLNAVQNEIEQTGYER